MADGKTPDLQAMIRMIAPARALKEQIEKYLNLEVQDEIGDMVIANLTGMLTSLRKITDDDPYISSLKPNVLPGASDLQKLTFVDLAAGQIVAYLEGQVGMPSGKGSSGPSNVVGGPQITIGGDLKIGEVIEGMEEKLGGLGDRVSEAIERAFGKKKSEE